jgi:hypothetical protein
MMEAGNWVPTLWNFSILSCTIFLIYLLGLGVYRLYLSPLATFPGPKLAALSNWYEFYYDVIQEGQFTFHIQELHKQYGRSPVLYYPATLL